MRNRPPSTQAAAVLLCLVLALVIRCDAANTTTETLSVTRTTTTSKSLSASESTSVTVTRALTATRTASRSTAAYTTSGCTGAEYHVLQLHIVPKWCEIIAQGAPRVVLCPRDINASEHTAATVYGYAPGQPLTITTSTGQLNATTTCATSRCNVLPSVGATPVNVSAATAAHAYIGERCIFTATCSAGLQALLSLSVGSFGAVTLPFNMSTGSTFLYPTNNSDADAQQLAARATLAVYTTDNVTVVFDGWRFNETYRFAYLQLAVNCSAGAGSPCRDADAGMSAPFTAPAVRMVRNYNSVSPSLHESCTLSGTCDAWFEPVFWIAGTSADCAHIGFPCGAALTTYQDGARGPFERYNGLSAPPCGATIAGAMTTDPVCTPRVRFTCQQLCSSPNVTDNQLYYQIAPANATFGPSNITLVSDADGNSSDVKYVERARCEWPVECQAAPNATLVFSVNGELDKDDALQVFVPRTAASPMFTFGGGSDPIQVNDVPLVGDFSVRFVQDTLPAASGAPTANRSGLNIAVSCTVPPPGEDPVAPWCTSNRNFTSSSGESYTRNVSSPVPNAVDCRYSWHCPAGQYAAVTLAFDGAYEEGPSVGANVINYLYVYDYSNGAALTSYAVRWSTSVANRRRVTAMGGTSSLDARFESRLQTGTRTTTDGWYALTFTCHATRCPLNKSVTDPFTVDRSATVDTAEWSTRQHDGFNATYLPQGLVERNSADDMGPLLNANCTFEASCRDPALYPLVYMTGGFGTTSVFNFRDVNATGTHLVYTVADGTNAQDVLGYFYDPNATLQVELLFPGGAFSDTATREPIVFSVLCYVTPCPSNTSAALQAAPEPVVSSISAAPTGTTTSWDPAPSSSLFYFIRQTCSHRFECSNASQYLSLEVIWRSHDNEDAYFVDGMPGADPTRTTFWLPNHDTVARASRPWRWMFTGPNATAHLNASMRGGRNSQGRFLYARFKCSWYRCQPQSNVFSVAAAQYPGWSALRDRVGNNPPMFNEECVFTLQCPAGMHARVEFETQPMQQYITFDLLARNASQGYQFPVTRATTPGRILLAEVPPTAPISPAVTMRLRAVSDSEDMMVAVAFNITDTRDPAWFAAMTADSALYRRVLVAFNPTCVPSQCTHALADATGTVVVPRPVPRTAFGTSASDLAVTAGDFNEKCTYVTTPCGTSLGAGLLSMRPVNVRSTSALMEAYDGKWLTLRWALSSPDWFTFVANTSVNATVHNAIPTNWSVLSSAGNIDLRFRSDCLRRPCCRNATAAVEAVPATNVMTPAPDSAQDALVCPAASVGQRCEWQSLCNGPLPHLSTAPGASRWSAASADDVTTITFDYPQAAIPYNPADASANFTCDAQPMICGTVVGVVPAFDYNSSHGTLQPNYTTSRNCVLFVNGSGCPAGTEPWFGLGDASTLPVVPASSNVTLLGYATSPTPLPAAGALRGIVLKAGTTVPLAVSTLQQQSGTFVVPVDLHAACRAQRCVATQTVPSKDQLDVEMNTSAYRLFSGASCDATPGAIELPTCNTSCPSLAAQAVVASGTLPLSDFRQRLVNAAASGGFTATAAASFVLNVTLTDNGTAVANIGFERFDGTGTDAAWHAVPAATGMVVTAIVPRVTLGPNVDNSQWPRFAVRFECQCDPIAATTLTATLSTSATMTPTLRRPPTPTRTDAQPLANATPTLHTLRSPTLTVDSVANTNATRTPSRSIAPLRNDSNVTRTVSVVSSLRRTRTATGGNPARPSTPSRTRTLPPTPTVSSSVSRSRSSTCPSRFEPPQPLPTIALPESQLRADGLAFDIDAFSAPWAGWPSTLAVGAVAIAPGSPSFGVSAALNGPSLLSPLTALMTAGRVNVTLTQLGGGRFRLRIPPLPSYEAPEAGDELAVRILPAYFAQCAPPPGISIRIAAIVVDAVPSPAVQAVKVFADTVTSTATVAGLVGGPAAAVDAQGMAIVGMVSCARRADAQLVSNKRLLSPAALDDTFNGMVWGNLILLLAIWLLQWLAVVAYSKVGKKPFDEAAAMLRFPSITLKAVTLLYQGTGFAALQIVLVPFTPGSSFMLGMFGCALTVVTPFALVVFGKAHIIGAYHAYECGSEPLAVRVVLRVLMPWGQWQPKEVRQRYSPLFAIVRRNGMRWLLVQFASPVIMLLTTVGSPARKSSCKTVFGLAAAAHFILMLVIWIAQPQRSHPYNVLQGISYGLMAIFLTHSAEKVDAQGAPLTSNLAPAVVGLQMCVVALRMMYMLLLQLIEARVMSHLLAPKPLFIWCADFFAGTEPPPKDEKLQEAAHGGLTDFSAVAQQGLLDGLLDERAEEELEREPRPENAELPQGGDPFSAPGIDDDDDEELLEIPSAPESEAPTASSERSEAAAAPPAPVVAAKHGEALQIFNELETMLSAADFDSGARRTKKLVASAGSMLLGADTATHALVDINIDDTDDVMPADDDANDLGTETLLNSASSNRGALTEREIDDLL